MTPVIIFIPILINNVGDGLAEPVGVRFGKHKYTTTALYYKGKFWNSEFTPSYERSSCLYLTSLIVVAANYGAVLDNACDFASLNDNCRGKSTTYKRWTIFGIGWL